MDALSLFKPNPTKIASQGADPNEAAKRVDEAARAVVELATVRPVIKSKPDPIISHNVYSRLNGCARHLQIDAPAPLELDEAQQIDLVKATEAFAAACGLVLPEGGTLTFVVARKGEM